MFLCKRPLCSGRRHVRINPLLRGPTVGKDKQIGRERVYEPHHVVSHGPMLAIGSKTRRGSPQNIKPPQTVLMNGGRRFTDGLQRRG